MLESAGFGGGAPGKYMWWEWWLAIDGWCALEWRGGSGVGFAKNCPTAEALWAGVEGCEGAAPVLVMGSVPDAAAATAAACAAFVVAATWCTAWAWAAAAAAAWRFAILF